ncbi:TPA: hypothetical protein ACGIK9_003318 [Acinetobacter baumannii]|uniref:hypothetical protein n=1 Tax=Acinetobacter baumannii TaxID=470 RepID=UPI00338E8AB2
MNEAKERSTPDSSIILMQQSVQVAHTNMENQKRDRLRYDLEKNIYFLQKTIQSAQKGITVNSILGVVFAVLTLIAAIAVFFVFPLDMITTDQNVKFTANYLFGVFIMAFLLCIPTLILGFLSFRSFKKVSQHKEMLPDYMKSLKDLETKVAQLNTVSL